MTSDLPPLSKTHPTLCAEIGQAGHRPPVSWWLIKPLQETTVDIAEHLETLERLKIVREQLADTNLRALEAIVKSVQVGIDEGKDRLKEKEEEIERLKKELEAVKRYGKFVELKPLLDGAYQAQRNEFIAEGERRAMQRVKEVYAKFACRNKDFCSTNRVYCSWCDFGKELGLSDKDDEHTPGDNNCLCQQCVKDDEVQP